MATRKAKMPELATAPNSVPSDESIQYNNGRYPHTQTHTPSRQQRE